MPNYEKQNYESFGTDGKDVRSFFVDVLAFRVFVRDAYCSLMPIECIRENAASYLVIMTSTAFPNFDIQANSCPGVRPVCRTTARIIEILLKKNVKT